MSRRYFRPGVLVGHLLVLAAALTCLRLGWWQWGVAHATRGTAQNLGYALLWPVFAGAFIYMWLRFLHLESVRDAELEELTAGDPGAGGGTTTAESPDQGDGRSAGGSTAGADVAAGGPAGGDGNPVGRRATGDGNPVGGRAGGDENPVSARATGDVAPAGADANSSGGDGNLAAGAVHGERGSVDAAVHEGPVTAAGHTARTTVPTGEEPDRQPRPAEQADSAMPADDKTGASRKRRRRQVPQAYTIAVATVGGDDDDDDPELAAYNRALAALAEQDRRRAR